MVTARMVMSRWTNVIQYVKKGLRRTDGQKFSGPFGETLAENNFISHKIQSAVLPVIIHVLNLPFDIAVNALAVRPVCETADHAEPVRPLLFGKQLLNRNGNSLSPLLMAVDAHNFLFQTHLGLDQTAIFRLPPSSL